MNFQRSLFRFGPTLWSVTTFTKREKSQSELLPVRGRIGHVEEGGDQSEKT